MPILHGIILNIRPARSARAYSKIWTERGSPLMLHTLEQTEKLRERLAPVYGDRLVVDYAFRYGEPSLPATYQRMAEQGVRKLLVLPLFPQYSGSTTASIFDKLSQDFSGRRWLPDFRMVTHYHDHPLYIEALADSVRQYQAQHGGADRLLFSFHGVPRDYLEKGDPYYCECQKTSRLLRESLQLDEEQAMTVFQSRFGRQEWLKPYTDVVLSELPGKGVKSVQIMCPGFSSDCLETLEEIAMENKDLFLGAGGERYEYIPALNSDESHLTLLESLVRENLAGW